MRRRWRSKGERPLCQAAMQHVYAGTSDSFGPKAGFAVGRQPVPSLASLTSSRSGNATIGAIKIILFLRCAARAGVRRALFINQLALRALRTLRSSCRSPGARPRTPAPLTRRSGGAPPSRSLRGPSAGPEVIVPRSPLDTPARRARSPRLSTLRQSSARRWDRQSPSIPRAGTLEAAPCTQG